MYNTQHGSLKKKVPLNKWHLKSSRNEFSPQMDGQTEEGPTESWIDKWVEQILYLWIFSVIGFIC